MALTVEQYQSIIQNKVRDAIRRGHRPYTIGRDLANDFAFVRKLFDPDHPFKLSTMMLVHSRLHMIEGDPALPQRIKKYLETSCLSS